MPAIAELNLLVRAHTELPDNLKLPTDEFGEGWKLVRSVDARRLEEEIVTQGWSFTGIADGPLRNGVGDTSEEAIGNALKLALRHISVHFNTVEVEHIELTQYPWFFLARVQVNPFRIQQGAPLPMPEEAKAAPAARRQRPLPIDAEVLYPHFGGSMPTLKKMLVSYQGPQDWLQ
jgi:hypothetical protein